MISLFVLRGVDKGQRTLLDRGEYTVGRESNCDIRLFDEEVSRQHAILIVKGDSVQLVDLKSSNGTYVNQARIHSVELKTGDHLQFGQTTFLLGPFDAMSPHEVDDQADPDSRTINSSLEDTISINNNELSEISNDVFQVDSATLDQDNGELARQIVVSTEPTTDVSILDEFGFYDPDQMLQELLTQILNWLPVDRGCLMIFNRDENCFTSQLIRYRDPQTITVRPKVNRRLVEHVCGNRVGILLNNLSSDGLIDDGTSLLGPAIRETICVPIIGHAKLHGVIYVDILATQTIANEPARLGYESLMLLRSIGQQAAVMLDNVEIYAQQLQSEKLIAIGQTLTQLSHHIKNILQSISGGQHLIEHGIENQNWITTKKGWTLVKRNQNSISNLVMDMLRYGATNQSVAVIADMNEVVGDAVTQVQRESTRSDVHFDWKSNCPDSKIMVDPDAIQTALVNVLRYCVESCQLNLKGRIFVNVIRNEESLEIDINDDGAGIPSDELPNLFTPFAGNDAKRIRGIGLAVAKKIVVQHGGMIDAVSKVGHGTNFMIRLPFLAAEARTLSV